MKLTVKTLKGSHFQITVHATDAVSNISLFLSPSPLRSICISANLNEIAFLVLKFLVMEVVFCFCIWYRPF